MSNPPTHHDVSRYARPVAAPTRAQMPVVDPTCPSWCRYPGDAWGVEDYLDPDATTAERIHGAPFGFPLQAVSTTLDGPGRLTVDVVATEQAPLTDAWPPPAPLAALTAPRVYLALGESAEAELDAAGARLLASWLLEAADLVDRIVL